MQIHIKELALRFAKDFQYGFNAPKVMHLCLKVVMQCAWKQKRENELYQREIIDKSEAY